MIHVLQCEDAFDDGKKAEIKKILKNTNFFLRYFEKRKCSNFLSHFSDADFLPFRNKLFRWYRLGDFADNCCVYVAFRLM